ncbi:hypothetical protein SBOR_4205 [Sclerotinia borealis F-4128]|uniref:Uncharacterized protein n=1 Tax=Sclerotinia borealis (strain F-4128) TaxID=1432307 RepID=W9CLN4_SCLBF|nr:hypothetical protein SBOR_4205 [Sclerotinia borealis F-4128]
MDDYGVGSGDSQNGNQGSSGGYGDSGQSSYGSSGIQTAQGQYNAATTAYQSAYTSAYTSAPTPTTTSNSQTNSAFPTSTSSSSSNGLSSSERTAIIAGVIGGVGALLIISLIAIYLLQKRKTKRSIARKGVAEQVSYNGLNSTFTGVPFIKRNSNLTDSEISRPPIIAETSHQGAYMRGGQSSYPDLSSDMETDRFLPSYEETQHRMSVGANESLAPSDNLISPATTRDPFTDQNRLSQMSQNTTSQFRPGPPIRHDTMGFPLDDDDTSYIGPDGQQHRLSRVMDSPRTSILEPTIISPAPIRPKISHENLEQGIWQTQNHGLNRTQPQHLDSLSSNYENPYELENENGSIPPINQSYGGEQSMSPISMPSGAWIAAHSPHLAAGNVQRNMSQRTESSFAPSVVSDTELDRLGVGHRMV